MCLVGCGSPGGANRGAVAVLDGVRKASFMVAAWGIGAGECCIFGCWLGECDSICCACALKIPCSRCSCDGAERGGGGRVALEGGGEAATSSGEACRAHEEVECGDCGSLSCIRADPFGAHLCPTIFHHLSRCKDPPCLAAPTPDLSREHGTEEGAGADERDGRVG